MTAKKPYDPDHCINVGLTIRDLRALLALPVPMDLRAHLDYSLDKAIKSAALEAQRDTLGMAGIKRMDKQ